MGRNGLIIDVRTPAEFENGHIPDAVNLPLFSNEERAVVGTIYKQHSKDDAVEKGLEFVGPKMAGFVKQAKILAGRKPLFIHCWRGGMRSASMAWLMETAGLKCYLLEGGYKAYRAAFGQLLADNQWNFTVLSGSTGCGKTSILKQLAGMGEQVLDLEGLAHHKGSAFGALGQTPQPTNEQFENDIHQAFIGFDPSRRIWVEGESRTIGTNFIPQLLFPIIESSTVVEITLPLEQRLNRLVAEYALFEPIKLIESFLKIKKRLGGLRTEQAISFLLNDNYRDAAEIALQYYDKSYSHTLSQRKGEHISFNAEIDDPAHNAKLLIELMANKNTKY
jgi:tRNA 2-selenouridine synthase